MSSPAQALIAASIFAKEGYIPAGQSPLLSQLDQIEPFGDTAMLSSMKACLDRIMRVNSVLAEIDLGNAFNFVHIVITDGVDNQSTATIQDVAGLFMAIGQMLPVERCKTYIIGIDLDQDPRCRAQLDLLDQVGGENCEKYDIESVEIEQVFARISVSLGVQRQVSMALVAGPGGAGLLVQQRARSVLAISRNNFAVLFNLDISGSMSGQRWARVKSSVRSFMGGLSHSDLVSCVCFNGEVMSIDRALEESEANQAELRQGPSLQGFLEAPSSAFYRPSAFSPPQYSPSIPALPPCQPTYSEIPPYQPSTAAQSYQSPANFGPSQYSFEAPRFQPQAASQHSPYNPPAQTYQSPTSFSQQARYPTSAAIPAPQYQVSQFPSVSPAVQPSQHFPPSPVPAAPRFQPPSHFPQRYTPEPLLDVAQIQPDSWCNCSML